MGYWKWLGKSLKEAAMRERVKAVWLNPITEYFVGFAGACVFFVFGLSFGIGNNPLYFLSMLGIIPSALMMSHGEYRRERRREESNR
jgi:hypothetical protein